jgi:hypothetical protein
MRRNSYIQFINKLSLFAVVMTAIFSNVLGQETVPVDSSKLVNAKLPANASRVTEANVPAEVNDALWKLIAAGGDKIRQGDTEVLAWTSGFKKSNASNLIKQMSANLQNAGWDYEVGGENEGVTVFSATSASPKRVVIGFYTFSDDTFVWAWTEMLAVNQQRPNVDSPKTNNPKQLANNSSAKIVTVDKDTKSVNVMGNEMPPMPQFPALQPKAGKVRGYVKDWSGKPLAGAEIGVRSSYFAGYYSGGQGKTDANGYYELTPPKGTANFYNAGYQIEYGDGVAAVSLHPADGKLDSFVTANGAVENFVLLPYGITSREKLQDNSHLPSSFYGGAISLSWYSVEANDGNAPTFAVKEGTALEITLTPDGKMLDGSAEQTIVVRKTAGISGAFKIHNIPLGRYRISIKANGKSLKIKDNRPNQNFGMKPVETTGQASILFVPDTAKASTVSPQHGAWNWIDLRIETP